MNACRRSSGLSAKAGFACWNDCSVSSRCLKLILHRPKMVQLSWATYSNCISTSHNWFGHIRADCALAKGCNLVLGSKGLGCICISDLSETFPSNSWQNKTSGSRAKECRFAIEYRVHCFFCASDCNVLLLQVETSRGCAWHQGHDKIRGGFGMAFRPL